MSKPVATWNDIPPEIIEKILDYSDDSSLLVLSKCNRQLNWMALYRYLEPERTGILQHHSIQSPVCFLTLNKKDIIYALNIALWLPHVQRLCWFSPKYAGKARIIRDIRGLTSLVAKCTPPLKTLWVANARVLELEEYLLSELLRGLLGAALSKGCETLALETPCGWIGRQGVEQRTLWSPESWLNYCISSYSHANSNISGQHQPLTLGTACLRELDIKLNMLFQPSFLPHFSSILRQHAATLHRLSITSYEQASDEAWEEYFAPLHFPSLEFLKVKLLVRPQQIIDFLSRHPTLTTLEISCLGFPDGWPEKAWAILPGLRSLKGDAPTIAWLLKCSDACPQLNNIHVTSEGGLWLKETCCIGFEEAINAVGGLSSTVPLKLEIDLDFGLMSSLPWMREHVARGMEKRGLRHSLNWSRVTKLKLQSCHCWLWFRRVPELMIQWLALFTSLEELEIGGCVFEDDLSNRDSCDAIRAVCPTLKVFEYGY